MSKKRISPLTVRLSQKEIDALWWEAHYNGMSRNAYIRKILNEAIIKARPKP
jgi:predicted DNA binding CopG/RHH family protein